MKTKTLNRLFSLVASCSLLLNSLYAPLAVLAQEVIPTPELTPIIEESPSPVPTIEPTAEPTLVPTSVPTEEPTAIPTATATPTVFLEPTPTQALSQWTFEKVEVDKEYVAPQNSGVKLTFTKLPDPSGNIRIEEITLTEDQIKQTGSLSDKAYDITSDMVDGSFAYNLSLPIPESSKGKAVEIKSAENVSDLSKISDVTEATQKENDTITVSGLDHFTVFIITGTAPPSASNIIDDGDANFSTNVPWNNYAAGINGDHKYIANTAGNWARWTFTDEQLPVAGQNYTISVHWVVWNDHVTNATYRLYDSIGTAITTLATVDQNKKADGTSASNGTLSGWYVVPGVFTLQNGYYVQLETDGSNSRNIVADAIKIETASAPSEVWVDKNWASQTIGTDLGSDKVYGYNSFSNIQSAISAVSGDGTVNVAAGTYTEVGQIVINKNISIIGADKTTTIIKPNQNTSTSGDSRGWFLVNSGESFTLENVTLDGTGKNIHTGIRNLGNTTLTGNVIKNTSYPGYLGFAVNSNWEAAGDTLLTVKNNTFSGYGRVGVHVDRGSGTSMGLIDNNIFVGKGEGDHLDYAIEVEGGASATITNNDISNNKGIASSDGSTSAGILATTFFAPGTNITLTNNSIHDNSYGVALGYGSGDTTSVTQFDTNIFNNNIYDLDNSTVNNVDARNNTWSVADQNSLDQIEAKINHYCSGSTYVHGACSETDDYGTGFGMVQYENIETPSNLGWNLTSLSVNPYDTPLDLTCTTGGVYTNENSLAQNWSAVGGSNIKYQREVTFPNSSIAFFSAGSNNYTPFSSFGSGDEGLWGTRVRAFVDADGNGSPDGNEETSAWSNQCNITYDKTNPTDPGTPTTSSYLTNNILQNWLWLESTDISGSGVKGYWQNVYNVLTSGSNTWNWIGNVLGISTNLTNGQWQLQLKAEDNAGNQSGVVNSSTLTVDTVAPAVPTLATPVDGFVTKGIAFSQTWNPVSDAVLYGYESCNVDPGDIGVACSSVKYTATYTGTTKNVGAGQPDSHFWWRIRAKDAAGNWSGWSESREFIIDNTAPSSDPSGFSSSPAISTPTNDQTVNVSWTTGGTDALSGVDGYSYSFTTGATDVPDNTKDLEETAINITSTTLADETWYFHIRTVDNAGNWTSTAHYGPFTIETVLPTLTTVSIISNNSNSVYAKTGDTVTLTFTSSETVNTPTVTILGQSAMVSNLGGNNWQTAYATTGIETEGIAPFTIDFTDIAGNNGIQVTTTTDISSVTYDKTNPTDPGTPTPDVSSPTNSTVINWVWAAANGAVSGVKQYIWDLWNSTISVLTGTTTGLGVTTSGLTDETYVMKVTAEDNAGNQSGQVLSSNMTVDTTNPNAPTYVSSSHTPSVWNSDRSIDISWTATDPAPGSGIAGYSYRWSLNSTTIPDTISEGTDTSITSTDRSTSQSIYFHVRAVDALGHWGSALHYGPFWIDANPPTGSWVTPLNNDHLRSTVNLEVSPNDVGSGVKHVVFLIKRTGGSFTTISTDTINPYQGLLNTTTKTDGTYVLQAQIVDNVNRSVNKNINVTIDNTSPSVPVLTWPIDGIAINSDTPLMQWLDSTDIGSGVKDYEYQVYYNCLDPSNIPSSCSSFYHHPTNLVIPQLQAGTTPDGTYYWQVRAWDNAGNASSWSYFGKVTIDNIKPVTSIALPANPGYFNSGITILGTTTDANGVDNVSLQYAPYESETCGTYSAIDTLDNPLNNSPFNWSKLWTPLSDGNYCIKAFGTDLAGNVEDSAVVKGIVYDTTAPQLSWTSPVEDTIISGTIVILSVATDNLSGVASVTYSYQRDDSVDGWHQIDSLTSSPYQTSWDTAGLTLDTYNLKVIVTDKAGNSVELTRQVGVAAVVSGEASTTPSDSSAVVSWTTDRPTSSRVVYDTVSHGSLGVAPNYGYAYSTGTSDTSPKVLSHSVTITGLSAGGIYYYRTVSEGSPIAVGDENNFKTLTIAGAPAPSGGAGGGGLVAGITTAAVFGPRLAYGPLVSEFSESGTETAKPKEEVLGKEAEVKEEASIKEGFMKRNWVWIVVALVAVAGFAYLRRRSKKN